MNYSRVPLIPVREKGSCCKSIFSLPRWGWACTQLVHLHTLTHEGMAKHTEQHREKFQHPQKHPQHSHWHEGQKWPHLLLPGQLGLESGYIHTLTLDSQTHILNPNTHWVSWILTHVLNPSSIPGPFPHTALGISLYGSLPTKHWSNLKFKSNFHPEVQRVTQTENN